jgi:hypothetical protein
MSRQSSISLFSLFGVPILMVVCGFLWQPSWPTGLHSNVPLPEPAGLVTWPDSDKNPRYFWKLSTYDTFSWDHREVLAFVQQRQQILAAQGAHMQFEDRSSRGGLEGLYVIRFRLYPKPPPSHPTK